MTARARDTLVGIVAEYGDAVSADADRLKGLLADRLRGECRKEASVLVQAARSGVAAALRAGNGTPVPLLCRRLAQGLHDEAGVDRHLAAWAAASWALALGVITPEQAASLGPSGGPAPPPPADDAAEPGRVEPPPVPPVPRGAARTPSAERAFRTVVRRVFAAGLGGTPEGKDRVRGAMAELRLPRAVASRVVEEVKAEVRSATAPVPPTPLPLDSDSDDEATRPLRRPKETTVRVLPTVGAVAGILLVLLGLGFGVRSLFRGVRQPDAGKVQQARERLQFRDGVPIPARDLHDGMRELRDSGIIQKEYGGKVILVTGPVYRVSNDSVTLEAGPFPGTVTCSFGVRHRDRIKRLREGQMVTIRAEIQTYRNWEGGEVLKLVECEVVSGEGDGAGPARQTPPGEPLGDAVLPRPVVPPVGRVEKPDAVVTADYWPTTPGTTRLYDEVGYEEGRPPGAASRKRVSYLAGGVVETTVLREGRLEAGTLLAGGKITWLPPAARPPTRALIRNTAGLIEYGVVDPGGVHWLPVLKPGARAGDSWTYPVTDDTRQRDRVARFDLHLGRPCVVIEGVMTPIGSEQAIAEITEVLVRGVGLVERRQYLIRDGSRVLVSERVRVEE